MKHNSKNPECPLNKRPTALRIDGDRVTIAVGTPCSCPDLTKPVNPDSLMAEFHDTNDCVSIMSLGDGASTVVVPCQWLIDVVEDLREIRRARERH